MGVLSAVQETERSTMAYKQLPSTEFRVKYHVLTEPVEVTVLGRVIGRYIPTEFGRYWEPAEDEVIPEERIIPAGTAAEEETP
jgi:hypothetical protein